MALSVSTDQPKVWGIGTVWSGTVTFDDSYPTGGEAFAATDVGMVSFDSVLVVASGGYVADYDASTGKILVYWVDTTTDGAPLAQLPNTTDIDGVTARVLAIGS